MICAVGQHPDREVEASQVCAGCIHRIACDLRDVADLYVRISLRPAAGAAGPRVSGSREAPLPLHLDALDLTMPARAEGLTAAGREPDPGGVPLQVGYLSVASVLDLWVRDWRETRQRGEGLPAPTAVILADWLGKRLDWACAEHPAIAEFAGEIRQLRSTLHALTGDSPARPERLPAPCPGCDLLALIRDHAGVRCRACGEWWTEGQYHEWLGQLARSARMAA
jgi:hypothetical protein